MNLIKYLYQQSWKLLSLATVLSILAGLCATGLVAVLGKAVAGTDPLSDLALPFFALCLLYFAAKTSSEWFLLELTQSLVLHFRTSLSRKVLATPFKQLQGLKKHGLLVILTKDVDTFVDAFHMLPLAFGNAVIVLTCLGYIAYLSLPMFAVFAVCLIVCACAFHFAERAPLARLIRVREEIDVLYKNFADLIEGAKELKLNAARGRAFVGDVITPAAHRLKQSYVSGMRGYNWVTNVGAILFYMVIGVLVFVIPLVLPQKSTMVVSVTIILLYLIQPITDLMASLPTLRESAIALARIQQLDQQLSTDSGPESPSPFSREPGLTITLRDVCHQYPSSNSGSMFSLGPLNLEIRQGETLFVVGGNGSGKTTLAMMLVGLYGPEAGVIELGSVAISDDNREHYRQHFSAVFTDFHLFEHLLEVADADAAAEAERYIKSLQMEHKVRVEDGRFSTIDLSTGQRKRLALVSAYLEDRPFYLFDEWAADQDPEFKQVFYADILPGLKAKGKGVIVITHDDSYFSYADRVVKLEDGKIITETSRPRTMPVSVMAG